MAGDDITRLIEDVQRGDDAAGRVLLAQVYDELKRVAQYWMARERTDHTLQATALVHEAYMKLAGERDVPWSGRGHFYAAAAQAMRRILIDHARARAAGKRGGDGRKAALSLAGLPDLASPEESEGFLILDEALSRLEKAYPQEAEVVRLRFFAGLTVPETAGALGISEPTVKRHWAFARGWLRDAIERGGQDV
ncbi:MAG TPA: sigma-70 family RNA polymerase sigma factor [Phycisphaerales bacterium]|nr:sigma-70 family RNA polymerase sigma factor [Phycisphaerales bacterium]